MGFLTPRRATLAAAALGAALALPAAAFDDPEDMPEGAGREEAFYSCIACHSMQVVTRQGMSRAMWEDTIRLMVERHGMPELDPEDEALILAYLSEHFPAVAPGARRGWTNPFAP
jgi:mono/diheme cytochrome c family protein